MIEYTLVPHKQEMKQEMAGVQRGRDKGSLQLLLKKKKIVSKRISYSLCTIFPEKWGKPPALFGGFFHAYVR